MYVVHIEAPAKLKDYFQVSAPNTRWEFDFCSTKLGCFSDPMYWEQYILRILKTITFILETLLSLNVHSILTSLLAVFREVALWTKVHKTYFLFHKSTHLPSSNYAFWVIVWTQSPESFYLLILLWERREKWFVLSDAIAIL